MPQIALSRRDLVALVSLGASSTAISASSAAVVSRGYSQREIDAAVQASYERYRGLTDGANFNHPALINVPTGYFGVSLMTADGLATNAGQTQQSFSIQSISKVITLALVLEESGEQTILDSIGVDATGRVFNSIEAIEVHHGRMLNPMVNPGAIATAGRVLGGSVDEAWAKILAFHGRFSGRELTIDEAMYRSAMASNQRNRAMALLMSSYDQFPGDPDRALDLYTRQCSISVTARDLSVVAGTLANGGRNPVTGVQVVNSRHIPSILAVMATAGLYDTSGQWLFRTGLPAKSGVAGGMIAVAPGKFGIGTFAPPLDAAGNSVRGQRAILDISDVLGGNPYAFLPSRICLRGSR